MKGRLIDGYLEWLRPYDMLDNYVQLLTHLNEIPFEWKREMDQNQVKHAEEFREKIAKMYGIKYNYFVKPSVLEVLLALADRFSEVLFIPGDQQADGFYEIFSLFLENLGLDFFDDDNFNQERVDEIVKIWMDLKYNRDGTGGNIVSKPGYNKLKQLDIWMQLNKVFVPVFEHDDEFPIRHPYIE